MESNCFFMTVLFLTLGKIETSAWFTTEIKVVGELTNASTEDLIVVESDFVSHDKDSLVTMEINITNVSDITIPIQIKEIDYKLSPRETFSETFQEKVDDETSEIIFQLRGLNQ